MSENVSGIQSTKEHAPQLPPTVDEAIALMEQALRQLRASLALVNTASAVLVAAHAMEKAR